MHIRRLVKSGAASHTISLPKKWIERNKLNRGDLLYLIEKSDNELVISPEAKEDIKEKKEITINVDNKELDIISREVTSAYINNFTTINIIGKELSKKVKDIRKLLHDFIALEISEQTSTKIVAMDLLNMNEISFEKTIRRMDMMIRSILDDSINAVNGEDVYESVFFRDFDVNKLYFMMLRIIKSVLTDSKVAESFDVTSIAALDYYNMSMHLENLGDLGKEVCLISKELSTKEIREDMASMLDKIRQEYLLALKSYHLKDKESAHLVLTNRNKIIEECGSYLNKNNKADVAKMIIHFKEIENMVCNIARIALDN